MLFRRFTDGRFSLSHIPTLGAELSLKIHLIRSKIYNLKVCDAAGQRRFRGIIDAFLSNASAAVLVFDITNYLSFSRLSDLAMQLRRLKQCPLFVVGNKADEAQRRCVSTETAMDFCSSIDAFYMETSAKTGLNVSALFDLVALRASFESPPLTSCKPWL
jgi:small GTP-binding protein